MKNKKKYIVIFLLTFTGFLIHLVLETNVSEIIYKYIFDKTYQEQIFIIYQKNYSLNLWLLLRDWWINFEWTFDYVMIWTASSFQIFLPVLLAIPLIIETKNLATEKEILNFSLKISFVIFLAFFCFFLFAYQITGGVRSTYITRTMFIEFFGNQFYNQHFYLYYFLEGIIKFFIAPFFYLTIGILVKKLIKNRLDCINHIFILFLSLSAFASVISRFVGDIAVYFDPLTIFLVGSYDNVYISIVLLIDITMLFLMIILYKKRRDYGQK